MHKFLARTRIRFLFLYFYISIILFSILAGCAPTSQIAKGSSHEVHVERNWELIEAEKVYIKRVRHVNDLAWQLNVHGTKLCPGNESRNIGFMFTDTSSAPIKEKEVYSSVYGKHSGIIITGIAKTSPAEIAGLKIGDVVISVNNQQIPNQNAGKNFSRLIAEASKKSSISDINLKILRSHQILDLQIKPVLACSYPVILQRDDSLNAFADGHSVFITLGMYRFVENDIELMTVIAHELAHNSEGHISKKKGNYWLGGIVDIVAAGYGINTQGIFGKTTSSLFSQEFERDADYVGMYYLANAGIDTTHVAGFWRRMAIEHPSGIKENHGASHPSTAERWVNLGAAHNEIQSKILNELPLLPERK